MKRDGVLTSLWQKSMPDYESQTPLFDNNKDPYDVVIVGGGITGLTTALQLQNAGKKCIVAELHNIGFGTTAGTTAHLNTIFDTPYNIIEKDFGKDAAKHVCDFAKQAIALAENNARTYEIDCGFEYKDGYVYSQDDKQTDLLKDMYESSLNAGCEVGYVDKIPIPIEFKKALIFRGQAQINPIEYIYGIASAFEKAGGIILQNCRVTNVKGDDNLEVETSQGNINALSLIYATHIPPGVNILHFRCAPYRSYVMAIKVKEDQYPDALAYDLYDPYHYYRTQIVDGEKYLIAGGEDHKTAHESNTDMCFTKLESYLRKYFDIQEISYKWSSQYFEPADGLPYIGHLPGNPQNVFVATGFGGNGITYSHVAAIVLTDLITKGTNEHSKLFDPNRIKPVAGFTNFVKENVDVVARFVGKWFASEKIEELAELAPGEAKIVKHDGHNIALYKDEKGVIHSVNPTCPHVKCAVGWNNAEKSWDCPCHGSRFSPDGVLLTGPARSDLEKIDIRKVMK
ncbi:FAD-dependent oxidoreductase [soil metagenome]